MTIKIVKPTNKLNGWIRIWIVFSTIWISFFVWNGIRHLPNSISASSELKILTEEFNKIQAYKILSKEEELKNTQSPSLELLTSCPFDLGISRYDNSMPLPTFRTSLDPKSGKWVYDKVIPPNVYIIDIPEMTIKTKTGRHSWMNHKMQSPLGRYMIIDKISYDQLYGSIEMKESKIKQKQNSCNEKIKYNYILENLLISVIFPAMAIFFGYIVAWIMAGFKK